MRTEKKRNLGDEVEFVMTYAHQMTPHCKQELVNAVRALEERCERAEKDALAWKFTCRAPDADLSHCRDARIEELEGLGKTLGDRDINEHGDATYVRISDTDIQLRINELRKGGK